MEDNPDVPGIIAILIGMVEAEGREFGQGIKGHLGRESELPLPPFGQEITTELLDLLGVHPDGGLF